MCGSNIQIVALMATMTARVLRTVGFEWNDMYSGPARGPSGEYRENRGAG
jgi:hypothetical protein